jgi:hypothetical protein
MVRRKTTTGFAYIVADSSGRNTLGDKFKTRAGAVRAKSDINQSKKRVGERITKLKVKKIRSNFFTKSE